MALVLIDVDGTLIEGGHSERLFIFYLLKRGWLGPRQLGAFGFFCCRYGLRYGRRVLKKNKAYLSGLPVAAVERIAAEYVDTVLLERVCRPLKRRLEQHAAAGDILALLTGTPEFIARPLAARCSIAHLAATVCDQRGGVFTARPPCRHPFAEAKIAEAEALCRRFGLSLSDCAAYADSIHDLPLMKRVGRAVAVAPDKALREQARRWEWEVLGA